MTDMRYPVLDHLAAMTDDTGLVQHALHDIPNRASGYCTDDIARALIVTVDACRNSPSQAVASRLARTYLAYLHDAQMHDGWFHNFMGYDRTWQDRRGSPDSFGRALWGLGYCMRFAPQDSWRKIARRLVVNALPHAADLTHLRSYAYAALGFAHAAEASPDDREMLRAALRTVVSPIDRAFDREVRSDWAWCEPVLTYDNARLAEALLRGGQVLSDPRLREIGLRMLDFYIGVVIEDGMFVPIGNDGWYRRGAEKARYGQQPIEAAGLIDACLAARAVTGDVRYLRTAQTAFDWFFGANTARALLVSNGGCYDGIDAGGANANAGAESTLAYLHGAMAISQHASSPVALLR